MRINRSLGLFLLAIWLIATGLLEVVHISIPNSGVVLAVLAILAGLLILLGR
jgi:hypothetical protein